MNENLENNDWMKDAPKLATLQRNNPFCVPDGYFDQSVAQISNSIYIDQLKDKTSASFTIPINYFEELPDQIEARIAVEELLSIRKSSFTTPDNYFEDFESRITTKIARTEVKQRSKIFKLFHSDLLKYATAACFVLLSASGLYLYQNTEVYIPEATTTDFTNEQMLYNIDENVIIDHIQNNTSSPSTVSASDTEMENYILNHYSPTDLVQELKQ